MVDLSVRHTCNLVVDYGAFLRDSCTTCGFDVTSRKSHWSALGDHLHLSNGILDNRTFAHSLISAIPAMVTSHYRVTDCDRNSNSGRMFAQSLAKQRNMGRLLDSEGKKPKMPYVTNDLTKKRE